MTIQYRYKNGQFRAEVPIEDQPAWWHVAVEFGASISEVPWGKPQGEPDPSWRVFDTRAATRGAARAAAGGAAWAAARDAAWDAAWAAMGGNTVNAAWDAAWSDVYHTTWNAVENTTLDALDATRDATLMMRVLITSDLNVDEKHRAHARARWDVWKRGYGLWGDVNGALYVYRSTA